MVTRVGPLELVIIGLEKASLVTHNGSFPPILFFVQSFSSLLCIIFSPHLNDTKRSKRLLQNGVFLLKYKSSQSFKQYHPEENISDLSFCFWFNALACAIFMTRTRVYLWIPPRTKTLQLFNYVRWPALANFGFTKEHKAHCMEVSKVPKNQERQ